MPRYYRIVAVEQGVPSRVLLICDVAVKNQKGPCCNGTNLVTGVGIPVLQVLGLSMRFACIVCLSNPQHLAR